MTVSGLSQHVALLTAGKDKPYAFGLITALRAVGVRVDVVAGQELDIATLHDDPGVTLHLLRREPVPGTSLVSKAIAIVRYYLKLAAYARRAQPSVFHILWNNKFETIDRVVLMLYYRWLGKRVVLTAHNVNTEERDARDSTFNRLTLRIQYRLCDHVFVHTDKMKIDLVEGFAVAPERVSVIQFGINNSVPRTALTVGEAKSKLGLSQDDHAILFFGNIAPYKGLEYLTEAVTRLRRNGRRCRLLIAGRPKGGFESYWASIKHGLDDGVGFVIRDEFIPDDETEIYFLAADVLALPYTSIFQSGVLVLGYSFGLPALAADIGSLKNDIVEGKTGFVFESSNVEAIAHAIDGYFASPLFENLDAERPAIQAYANRRYSWQTVADTTLKVYASLQGASQYGAAIHNLQ